MAFDIDLLAWYSTSAYMALLPTKIVSYNHIALLYAFIPVVSVLGPIFTGNTSNFFEKKISFECSSVDIVSPLFKDLLLINLETSKRY